MLEKGGGSGKREAWLSSPEGEGSSSRSLRQTNSLLQGDAELNQSIMHLFNKK